MNNPYNLIIKRQTTLQKNIQNIGNRYFTKENISMIWLVINEIHVKTTVKCQHTPTRISNILKSDNIKCWKGCGAPETLIHSFPLVAEM